MFSFLMQQPNQTVSAVARGLKVPLPVASQYLRALEARGFLTPRRVGGRVYYSPSSLEVTRPAAPLVEALRVAFQRETDPIDHVFRLATAFTHPRRIAIFRALSDGDRTVAQVQATTGMSRFALIRHLAKLEARGFVISREGTFTVVSRRDAFGRALARLASP
jgi:DNA-binding transcriptional ArsR family regulator